MPLPFLKQMKKEFPLLAKRDDLIYFDTAATAQKPKAVLDAMDHFLRHDYATVHRAVYDLSLLASALYEETRDAIALFINAASREEIVYTTGTTGSINLLAYALCNSFFKEGDEILLTEAEHHSNLVPWQLAAQRKNLVLRFIKITDQGELDLDSLRDNLTEKTKLVSLAHISNVLGTVFPLKEVRALSKEKGALLFVDAAQSIAHQNIDVQDLDVDFLAFSTHKAYGPTGLGVLYGKKHLLNMLPPFQSGGDMVDSVSLESATFRPSPLRFEAGTPNITSVIGFKESLSFLSALGLESIKEHEKTLMQYALQRFSEIKEIRLIGTAQEKGAIQSFVLDGVHPLDLSTLLNQRNICIRTGHLCQEPLAKRFGGGALCRISFGLYNTCDEIDRFFEHLTSLIKVCV